MNKATIELEVLDTSTLQVAHAIIKYYMRANQDRSLGLIDLEELCDHITAFIKADKRALEVQNE